MEETQLLQAIFNATPYFGSSYAADSGSPFDPYLTDLAVRALEQRDPVRILVVGAWLGRMACPLAASLERKKGNWRLTCLEDFHRPVETEISQKCQPTPVSAYYEEAARSGVLRHLLIHNLRHLPGGERATFAAGPFQEMLDGLPEDAFDLIVINGPRTVPGFSKVLERCRLLTVQGGIICGTGHLLDAADVNPDGHAHGLRFKMGYIHDENTGRYYHPEVTEALNACGGIGTANDGFWAFFNDSMPRPIQLATMARAPDMEAAETDFFRIVPGLNSRWLAVSKGLPEGSLFNERIGERSIPGLIYVCEDKKAAQRTARKVERRERRKNGVLLAETRHYWLGKYGSDVYLAQSKHMAPDQPFRIFDSRIGDCELRPAILKAATLSELKEKVAAQESIVKAGKQALPCISSYMDYYIFAGSENLTVAVQVDLKHAYPFASFVGEEDMAPYVLVGNSIDELKDRINRLSSQQEQRPLVGHGDVEEWM